MSAASEIDRMHTIVGPIASDLSLDVYDIERRGATIRVTLDTLPGSDGGITLDSLSLATRLISRELDHDDPVAGHYTLEVTSPGLERALRTPAHYQREAGKTINVRLSDPEADPRRLQGLITAADEQSVTLLLDDGTERVLAIRDIDKARTVFEWGPQPKPGKQPSTKSAKKAGAKPSAKQAEKKPSKQTMNPTSTKEKQPS